MGEIWLAERRGISGFSKRVVVKTILDAYSDDPELVEMFLREGRIAAGLTHPNIAQTFDLGREGETYFIAMEHVDGRDLRDLLISNIELGRQIPLNLVLCIIAEVCEGLHHAHSWKTPDGQPAGIIHRDISPQNILVTFDGGVKIVDFGVAKAAHMASKTRSGVLKGKYSYMSPEQIRGKKMDGRADLFSLGVVMYETVTGRRLFKRESEVSTLDAVLHAQVPQPTRIDGTVPADVEAIIMKALAPNPDERFQTAREMQLVIEDTMLASGLTASSAYLSTYMHDLFGENGSDEDEASAARLSRLMDDLPGAEEEAPQLTRTEPFINGSSFMGKRPHEPTRNLLAPASEVVQKKFSKSWIVLGFSFILVATSSWYLVSVYLGKNNSSRVEDSGIVADDAGSASRQIDGGGSSTPIAPGVPGIPDGRKSDWPDAGNGGADGDVPNPEDVRHELPADRRVAKHILPRHSTGLLSVTTDPPADIFLGRRKLGRGSIHNLKVPAGNQRLRAVVRKGISKTLAVRIARGRHLVKNIVFKKGTLLIVVRPWADVWVDGKMVGQAPMKPISLLEGTHKVSLVNSDLKKKVERKVRIEAGREKRITADLR